MSESTLPTDRTRPSPDQALAHGNVFLQLGTSARALREGQDVFTQRKPGD